MTVSPLAPEAAAQLPLYKAGDTALMVSLAEAAVRAHCGWHIAPTLTTAVTVDGSGALVLPLPTLHLLAVTGITEDGAAVDVADVQWSQVGYLWRATPWTRNLRGVQVTLTHGHAEVPPEVQAVVLAAAARATTAPASSLSREEAGPFVRQLARNNDGSYGGVTLTELERAILERYKVPVAA